MAADRTPSAACVCGEINMRHCPVHGQGETVAVKPRRWFYRDVFRLRLFGKEWLLELRWRHVY